MVQPLLRGDGEQVVEGSTVTVQYTGVRWSDGSAYDSSWAQGGPQSFDLGAGVLPGLAEGLLEQTVGSQVLLVIPPASGGAVGGEEDTLVLVVDLLAASPRRRATRPRHDRRHDQRNDGGGLTVAVALRVVPCLDVDAGRVVKGVNFENLRDAGDPVELARRYDAEGADEVTFLDVSASSSRPRDHVRRRAAHGGGDLRPAHRRRRRAQRRRRRPPAAGGGGQGRRQHRRHRPARADRRDRRPVRQPGARAVASTPAGSPGAPATDSGYEVTTHGGRRGTGIDAVAWAARAAELGAGEILLNSMDADGTKDGFDLEMLRTVRREVRVPLIASGGAGTPEHFVEAARAGADAVLAASVFHFGTLTVGEVKDALRAAGVVVR